MLLKLSLDDVKTHTVYERDLLILCVGGLGLFEAKGLDEWLLMILLILGLVWLGSQRQALGSGDLPVILTMSMMMSLIEFLYALQGAALVALIVFYTHKKAPHEEVPFVPYLSGSMIIIYLIRLRFIFS